MKIFFARLISAFIAFSVSLSLCCVARADVVTAAVGQKLTIQVNADGSKPFIYQWYSNGTAITGATSSSYTLNAVAFTDAASYTATITNSLGTVTSDAAVVTVIAPLTLPTILTQPVSQTVTAGDPVTFSVSATGSDVLKYQWTKGGVNISGATSSSYTIPSTVTADAGSYSVAVTNTIGTASSVAVVSTAATLTVNAAAPTSITSQPTALTVTAGQSATFSVTATGAGTLTYQWSKDGVNISGATSASYTISSTTAGSAGSYSVVVTGAGGTATSNAVALTVNAVTTITSQPTALTVTTGQSATFSVTATGSGTLTYQWRKDGTNISGATSASYTIASATSGSAGNYSVVVTGSGGSATSNAVALAVNTATTITSQPVALSVITGQPATFSVTAAGSGTLTYQWKKGGVNISGATSASYTISSTTSADAGNYSVSVTGTGGTVTSNLAALTVNPAPVPGAPDGYASLVTGGAAGTAITVSNAADLRTYAESAAAYVITVSGTINLSGSVLVKSNKTIQGASSTSTIVGQLDLSSGSVSNVIIRGLNITNTSGNGITLRNTSGVFISHCSVYDCSGNLIEISNGSDYVTVSWSEFYYSSSSITNRKTLYVGVAGSETKALHVTLHHNWWSDLCAESMPSGTYGYVHLFNNYFGATNSANALNNTSGTVASDNSQFLAERNNYNRIKDPLYKENLDTSKAAGRIRAIANSFTSCTGKAVDAGTDAVFTPLYSYEMYLQDDVDAVLPTLVGNTGGAGSTTPTASSATITGPSSAVSPGSSFTLTAVPTGFTGTSYQWRMNNVDISGATSSTYSVASMQSGNAGTYTVVIGLASGSSVVSAPLDVILGSVISPDPGGSSSSSGGGQAAAASSGGGGGGAPGVAYLAALLVLGLARAVSRRRAV